ncbi:hypothetical protein [Nocardia sp. CS682]|uniref:hypothetical protein n=1 Tax=Nocardia sp. CS682 TaxID=1047172 RepID=UPI001074B4EF|nr:hypothetical protein [Nocardia sp. CS682]QBS40407.1 hypothetical protein DMB37_10035 [Nocardia sp. CS682]
MSTHEPLHEPTVLLAELDSIIREQEQLRQRTVALQARYKALEPRPNSFDAVEIDSTASRLSYVHETYLNAPLAFLRLARESASCIREREQVARQADGHESIYGPDSTALWGSNDVARHRHNGPVPVSSGFARARTRELADRPRVDRGRSR